MIAKNPILPAFLVAKAVVPRPASAETYILHFKPVHSLILIDAAVNGLPVAMLFDTGATRTILSVEILGFNPANADMQFRESPYGLHCENPVELRVSLTLDRYELASVRVLPADLTDISRRLKTRCDGIVGQDLISTFNSVRIDYGQNIVQLEK